MQPDGNSDVVVRENSGRTRFRVDMKNLTRSRRRSSPSGIPCGSDSTDGDSHQVDLARSLSFKMNESSNFQSFCPSDLEFKELLGKGCFGEVYKVVHKQTGVVMVLKGLYRLDPKGEADFLQEAAFMRNLCHPNVLAILGVLYKDKKLHIVSEYLPCGSLRACIESNVQFSCVQRISIAKDVSAGMTYLHGKRIIHRDLTSSNILLRDKYANAVVADFGLALMLSRRVSKKIRLQAGDPYVMAPEMIREEPYDERADIFSYGITLCEMIGQCSVDPDVLPRTKNFGVDRDLFLTKFCTADNCPRPLYEIAFKCASVDPWERPPFSLLFDWISALLGAYLASDFTDFDQFVEEIRSFSLKTEEDQKSVTKSTNLSCSSCPGELNRSPRNGSCGRPPPGNSLQPPKNCLPSLAAGCCKPRYSPSSLTMGRWSLHRRKLSLDLGYDSAISPQGCCFDHFNSYDNNNDKIKGNEISKNGKHEKIDNLLIAKSDYSAIDGQPPSVTSSIGDEDLALACCDEPTTLENKS